MQRLLSAFALSALLIVPAQGVLGQELATSNKSPAGHPPGPYAGVKAGGDQLPAVAVTPGQGNVVITWPGFEMRPDGGSRVFIQATDTLLLQSRSKAGKLIVDLQGARIATVNNRRPLMTQYFNTPVTRVALTRNRKGKTLLTLSMRKDVEPRITSKRAKSGYYFLYIDFPPGDYLKGVEGAPPSNVEAVPNASNVDNPATEDQMPTFLRGDVAMKGSAKARKKVGAPKVDTSMDGELPPGVKGNQKTKAKAEGSTKIGV